MNLLVLMSDEHNPKMLGCAGHPLARTPHLDALAARGTRFEAAYTTCPICVPARASFATGRYVHQIGYWDNSMGYDGRVKSWGHRLQEHRIPSESIGKLHYRNERDDTGFDRQQIPMHIKDGVGMVHLSIRGQFPDFVPVLSTSGIIGEAGPGESEYTAYDRRVGELACKWLARRARDAGRPWVLFVSFVTPHYPLIAPDRFFEQYPLADMPLPKCDVRGGFEPHPWLALSVATSNAAGYDDDAHRRALAAYLGLVSFTDDQIGQVLAALDRSGLAERTRVLYTSDHGENAGARGLWGKSNHYEEASGIPLVLAGADIPEGRVSRTPVTLADAFPTILEATGIPASEADRDLPGTSLIQIANGPEGPERVAFSEYHAARSPSGSFMIRKGRYKYIEYVGYEPELFDLASDPEEIRDLAGRPAYAATVASMQQALRGIVEPEAADRAANDAQKTLVEQRGGPRKVMEDRVTRKHYTPVPDGIL